MRHTVFSHPLLCRRRGCQWKLKRAPVAWATWTSAGSLRRLSMSWVSVLTQRGNALRSNTTTWSESSWMSCQCNSSLYRQSFPQSISKETSQPRSWSRSIKCWDPVEHQYLWNPPSTLKRVFNIEDLYCHNDNVTNSAEIFAFIQPAGATTRGFLWLCGCDHMIRVWPFCPLQDRETAGY